MNDQSLIDLLEKIPPVNWTGPDGAEWLPRGLVLSTVRQHQAEAVCPYVVTAPDTAEGGGGTSYCGLAVQNGVPPVRACGQETEQDVVERVFQAIGANLNGLLFDNIEEQLTRATKAAIAAMGTETAVSKSTEQAKLGIAPEAAGLEPRCDQPVPASDRPSGYPVVDEEVLANQVMDLLDKYYPTFTTSVSRKIIDIMRPNFRQTEPVSLEVCASSAVNNGASPLVAQDVAKAILKLAGVAYAE